MRSTRRGIGAWMVLAGVGVSAGMAQTWQGLGPGPALDGQIEGMGAQRNPATGAVRIAAPHPVDPEVMYAGTVNGGIWKTTNALSPSPNWVPLTDYESSLSIGALEFDLLDFTHQTLVAGMGRFSSLSSLGGARSGLLRTTDGGETWTPLGTVALAERNISGLAVLGETILVAVNTGTQPGLYRSGDTGLTFQYLSGNGSSGLPSGAVTAVKADPARFGFFYCTVIGANGGVYRSNSFGQLWTNITAGQNGSVIGLNNAGNAKIALHSSPGHDIVYVSVVRGGQLNGVYRSADRGVDWESLGFPTTPEDTCDVGINPGGQGNIHQSLAADSVNPNIVYVGGDRQPTTNCDGGFFPNSIGARDYSGRLFRFDRERPPGMQWQTLTHEDTGSNSSPHADSRSLSMNPLGDLIESDDGGIYKRLNPRSPGSDWTSIIGNMAVGEFHSAQWDRLSGVAFGGTQDCGTSEQEFEGSYEWRTAYGGDGGKVAVDYSEPGVSIRYGSFQYLGAFNRRTVSPSNTLLGFEYLAIIVAGTDPPRSAFDLDSPQFYSPITVNRAFGPGMGFLTSRRVFVSYNRGDLVYDLGAPGGTPSAIVLGGRRNGEDNPHAIWVGCTNSRLVFRDTFSGVLTQITNYPGASNQTIRGIATDPEDYGTVIVADNTQVYLSRNLGAFWSNITGDLNTAQNTREPAIRWVEFVVSPVFGRRIVVAGTNGVFSTSASGPGVWTSVGEGLPKCPIREVRYDEVDDLLIAATLGRGVWMLRFDACPADFNGDGGVDGGDVEAFFLAWESAEASADVNRDGGIDGGDVEFFFVRWEAGGC
ncbi:MAG: hypothetical protein JNK25_01650 [Phycisphaerae bacterium]|nr:hypothetical protein [Phycisphaerae bacterium]